MDLAVPKGTQDVLPEQWQLRWTILDAARRRFDRAGYGRIQTPTFEDTALFVRGVGEGTDIVGKEMYTFEDRSGRSLTLRPEGTAPVARAYVSGGMHRLPQPVRLWYFAPMFRYEAPQKGRLREHYQIGAESFGSDHAAEDAEAIALLAGLYADLGVPNVSLRVNSIGDENCRPAYLDLLRGYLAKHADQLCHDCQQRRESNPLRTFDCKNEQCRSLMAGAPKLSEHLCDACSAHFGQLLALLDAAGIAYVRDDSLVRGLDYYTRTTFEFRCAALGAQDAIGGGGRYDLLVAQLGGPPTAGVGFGSGIERLSLALQASDSDEAQACDVYVCIADESLRPVLFALTQRLRDGSDLRVQIESMGRSVKGQLKQASRLGARLAVIADAGALKIYDMRTRDEIETTEQQLLQHIEERI